MVWSTSVRGLIACVGRAGVVPAHRYSFVLIVRRDEKKGMLVCAVARPTQHVADNGLIMRLGMLMKRASVRCTCRNVHRCVARAGFWLVSAVWPGIARGSGHFIMCNGASARPNLHKCTERK